VRVCVNIKVVRAARGRAIFLDAKGAWRHTFSESRLLCPWIPSHLPVGLGLAFGGPHLYSGNIQAKFLFAVHSQIEHRFILWVSLSTQDRVDNTRLPPPYTLSAPSNAYPSIMSSAPMTPNTASDTQLESSRLPSSQPSSPPTEPLPDQKAERTTADMEEDEDDLEGMDSKAKALTNLLKTSSVFVAIMADKMKDQQKQQQEAARKAAAKKDAKEEQKAATTDRRTTRASEKKHDDDDDVIEVQVHPKAKKLPTRSRPKMNEGKGDIASYFKKADIKQDADNPTVQEALEQAAEEFEAKPSAIGEQKLVATQQPKLITGGEMRGYQLEGLEWLKSLWMNGLCGILADEMGLGKTVQAISLLAFFKEHNIPGPFLIAAPLSTVSNWVDEFARWTPDIATVLYHGSKDEREKIRRKHMAMKDQKKSDFPVVCTSYEICMNDRKFLAQYQWKYIIVVSINFPAAACPD
jgi:SNF2 family DNA or RNA helicase